MDIKLIALDVDGTLLNSDLEVTAHTAAALARAHKAGIHVALSTGRIASECADILAALPFIRYASTCTGAEVLDLKTGRTIAGSRIPRKEAQRLYGLLQDLPVSLHVFDPKDQHPHLLKSHLASCETVCTPGQARHLRKFYLPEDDLGAYMAQLDRDIIKFHMYFFDAAAKAEALERMNGEPYTIAESCAADLEIMPPGIDKGTGLQQLAEALALKPEQVMVMGDGGNDVEQLRFAGLPVVMANGSEEAKACAKFITDDNDHDGVAKAVDMVLDGSMAAYVEVICQT